METLTESEATRYFDRITTNVFNYEKAYNELVFPLLRSEFYNVDDLDIQLITQEEAGTKLKRYIDTQKGTYALTIMLIPIKEIGRVMSKYKNSLLKYNPRNYLAMSKGSVNSKIRQTILDYPETGEFSLYNNGLTIFANECCVSEAVGRKGTAMVTLSKPQIINGGQTAFTLSTLYEEYKEKEDIFNNKEVVVKIISPEYDDLNPIPLEKHLEILKEISKSTNNQTPIEESDMHSNDELQIELQKRFFDKYGLLYERKKGEFNQAIKEGYLNQDQIIKRDDLIKLYLSFKGEPSIKTKTKKDIYFRNLEDIYDNLNQIEDIWLTYKIYDGIQKYKKGEYEGLDETKVGYSLNYGTNAVIYAYKLKYSNFDDFYNDEKIKDRLKELLNSWIKFETIIMNKQPVMYYKSKEIDVDIKRYFEVLDKENSNEETEK